MSRNTFKILSLLLLSTIATLAFAICGCDSKDSGESKSEPTSEEATTDATTEAQDVSEQYMTLYSTSQICSQM
ncbi:MAG: hypothetical protein IJO70_10540 [Lachnospiraceae bacterium]|nr:hypothetical protein [Lachnospiraceae bacterium]